MIVLATSAQECDVSLPSQVCDPLEVELKPRGGVFNVSVISRCKKPIPIHEMSLVLEYAGPDAGFDEWEEEKRERSGKVPTKGDPSKIEFTFGPCLEGRWRARGVVVGVGRNEKNFKVEKTNLHNVLDIKRDCYEHPE